MGTTYMPAGGQYAGGLPPGPGGAAPGLNFSNKALGLRESVEHYLVFTNPAVGHQVDMRLRPSGGAVVAPARARAQAGGPPPGERQGHGFGPRGLGAFAQGAGFGIQMMVRPPRAAPPARPALAPGEFD